MSSSTVVPNIGARGIRRRRIGGLVALASAVVLAGLLIVLDLSIWWRLLVVLPLWAAGLGLFQAKEKT